MRRHRKNNARDWVAGHVETVARDQADEAGRTVKRRRNAEERRFSEGTRNERRRSSQHYCCCLPRPRSLSPATFFFIARASTTALTPHRLKCCCIFMHSLA